MACDSEGRRSKRVIARVGGDNEFFTGLTIIFVASDMGVLISVASDL